jgi:phage-related minor tail protein
MTGDRRRVIKDSVKLQENIIKSSAEEQRKTVQENADEQIKSITEANGGAAGSFSNLAKSVVKNLEGMSSNGINQFARMAKGINAAFAALPIIGLIAAVAGAIKQLASGIFNWINETSKAYKEHAAELTKLDAVIKQTGATAWTTSRELSEMAKELSAATGASQNEIMKFQAILLGFKNVSGQIFERATKAALNMTAVIGGDLVSSANSLGKALDTPTQGISALSRQGFVFDKQTKELIATLESQGKLVEAQALILREYENSFGDAAEKINEVNKIQNDYIASQERLAIAQGTGT